MLSTIDVRYFKLAVGLDNIGKETSVDITARCPVCGDSRSNKRMKRLHLYIKNNVTNVNCFNGECASHNKTVYGFLLDFFPALLSQYKREKFTTTMEKLARGETDDVFASFKKEPALRIANKQEVLVQDLSSFFRDINGAPDVISYLRNRGITYDESKYGKWYFGFQDLKISDVLYKTTNTIVIPLYYEGTMYGFYSRNIYEKTFYTYMADANVGFKVWNWFNVDKNKPVYIFEGIFDAISSGLDNIIALMGAKLPSDRLSELKQPVFVLDNDKSGLVNSLIYCKIAPVYIQPTKYIEKDMNNLMMSYPELNLAELITANLYSGIGAEVRIKSQL